MVVPGLVSFVAKNILLFISLITPLPLIFEPILQISALSAEEISGGLSGAEVIAACRDAALLAMEEYETRENSLEPPKVTMQNLRSALTNMERQITDSMLEFYSSFQGKPTSVRLSR